MLGVFAGGFETRLRYFIGQQNKISNWGTEYVIFESSPGHKKILLFTLFVLILSHLPGWCNLPAGRQVGRQDDIN